MGLLAVVTLSAGPGIELAAGAQAPVRNVGVPVRAAQSAVVDMAALAKQAATQPARTGPAMTTVVPAPLTPPEPAASAPPFLLQLLPPAAGLAPQIASPAPVQDFAGLDDIANSFDGHRYIPPDTDGAVGLTKVMSGLNNDYRIWNKATGAEVSTVSTDEFWSVLGVSGFFDPKTLYDPFNDRWLVVMLSDDTTGSFINIGVSQTSDPSGSYYLFRVDADATGVNWADFPTIGFNKDYLAVNVNMFANSDNSYVSSKVLAINYAAMRAGTLSSWFLTGSDYTSSPAATYSPTESTLYVPTQPNGSPGTYRVDTITGTPPAAPVYTVGISEDRGVTWTEPGGNILPQAPATGSPAPMKIDCQDDMIRSTPVVRDGFIYYTQTVGLPAGGTLAHTSILWTKLTANTGNVAGGGLLDDPTATATNGGKWYAYPHIAVNKYGDVIVGFSQFSSAQYASAGYAVRAASDPAGTMREPVVYKAGQDVYQKDFGYGSNRWGDYSKAQVDPSNDADLWVVNEYAKPVTGSGDSGGVWGTWWAKVTAPTSAPVTITSFSPASGPVGTSVTISGSGFAGATAVRFNGTATTTKSVVSDVQITATVPAGATTGTIAVDAPGGTGTSAASFTVTVPVPVPTPVPPLAPSVTLKLSGLKSGAVKLGKRVTAKGAVTPTSLAGSKVTLVVQKKKGGKWRSVKSTARTIAANGSYSWTYKPAEKGSYRIRTSIATTVAHAAAMTKWRAFKVK